MAQPKQQRIDPKSVPPRGSKKSDSSKSSKGGRPGGRPPGAPPIPKATAGDWIAGARPQTLALAISPVMLGTATAYLISAEFHWVRALLCLAVAGALQIGVNYANDYSDGIRGTDNRRIGPSRLTGSGAARPRTVLIVALSFFGLAALAGLAVVVLSGQFLLLLVGAACIVAAWFYTGGKRPYGYYGLGELFVFVFFGIVATAGTTFVQVGIISIETWLAGAAAGFIACAVLMVNNIRDIAQDKVAGKRTLAVLIGDRPARIVYTVLLALPYVILAFFVLLFPNAGYTYFTLLLAVPAALITLTAKSAGELVLALRLTSLTSLLFAVGLSWAIAF